MKFHPGLIAKLKPPLISVLAKQQVRYGRFLDFETNKLLADLDLHLPNHGPTREALNGMIDDAPFSQFVSGWIHNQLSSNDFTEGAWCGLTDLGQFTNLESVATCILDAFQNLPYKYKFTTYLPAGLHGLMAPDETVELSGSVSLIRTGPTLVKAFPLTTGNANKDHSILNVGLLSFFSEQKLEGSYLQISADGYIERLIDTNPRKSAQDLIRSFFGLCLALGVVTKGTAWRPLHTKRNVYIHRRKDDDWTLIDKEELDLGASTLIDKLEYITLPDSEPSPLFQREVFNWNTERLSKFLRQPQQTERVLLASQWLFDSYASENELLAFVQAMVCLEIIFGEKASSDKIGLGELLRNRCAYLIGKTVAQRAEILDEFGAIYDVRSAIVHRGKSRITRKERDLFYKLLWYCSRSIQEEVKLFVD